MTNTNKDICHGCYWWNFLGMTQDRSNLFGQCGNEEESGKRITVCNHTCSGYKDREKLKELTMTFAIGQRVKVLAYDLPAGDYTGTVRGFSSGRWAFPIAEVVDVGEGYRRLAVGEYSVNGDEAWYGSGMGWKTLTYKDRIVKGKFYCVGGRNVRKLDVIRRKIGT